MGFTSPLELKQFRDRYKTNDVIDTMISLLAVGGARTTMAFIDQCCAAGVASPGTVHKYLQEMRAMHWVEEAQQGDDARQRTVAISAEGMQYLRAWMRGGAVNDERS